MTGRLIAVVGPSGAGKDSILQAAAKARPDLWIARRAITRAEEAGAEPFEGVSDAEFEARRAAGRFALHWRAHGLGYGVPVEIDAARAAGRVVIFNGSRAIIGAARRRYPDLGVILVTAPTDILALRLAARGRESAHDSRARLERAPFDPAALGPHGVVVNDGPLAKAVAAFMQAIALETG